MAIGHKVIALLLRSLGGRDGASGLVSASDDSADAEPSTNAARFPPLKQDMARVAPHTSHQGIPDRGWVQAERSGNPVAIQPFARPARLDDDDIPDARPARFDDDDIPDGISAWVQAHDAFGDPVKIVGDLVFELYTLRNASSERKGERLITWNHTIRTRNDQMTFWDRPSQTYQFELAWNVPPTSGNAFVLAVTLTTADDLHFSDEYNIHVNVNALRQDITGR